MRMRNNLIFTFVVVLLSACGSADNGAGPTPSSPGVTSSPAVTVIPSPSMTHSVAKCPGFDDNSDQVLPIDSFDAPIYYLFACYDERIIVRVDGGVGHVVHAPIQSEYNYGLIDFSGIDPVESIVYSNGLVSKFIPTYWGTQGDLHATKYARVAGPTLDVTDFYEQDCKDHMQTTGAKNCKKMTSGLAQFFDRGDKSNWKNGLPN